MMSSSGTSADSRRLLTSSFFCSAVRWLKDSWMNMVRSLRGRPNTTDCMWKLSGVTSWKTWNWSSWGTFKTSTMALWMAVETLRRWAGVVPWRR